MFNTLIVEPIFNLLVFIIYIMPGQNMAFAIIIMTIIVRFVLLLPSSHAIKQQQKIKEIQPKIDEIKKKHSADQKKLSEETMKLWKEHNINPAAGCLPLLVQIPIMFGLFIVFRQGINNDTITSFLYTFMPHIDISKMDLNFLWITDISQKEVVYFPYVLAISQFIQMFTMNLRINNLKFKKDSFVYKMPEGPMRMMAFMTPVLVFYSSSLFAAALPIYWLTSIIFSFIQQLINNSGFSNNKKNK